MTSVKFLSERWDASGFQSSATWVAGKADELYKEIISPTQTFLPTVSQEGLVTSKVSSIYCCLLSCVNSSLLTVLSDTVITHFRYRYKVRCDQNITKVTMYRDAFPESVIYSYVFRVLSLTL